MEGRVCVIDLFKEPHATRRPGACYDMAKTLSSPYNLPQSHAASHRHNCEGQ